MAKVGSKDTGPEKEVRSYLHRRGFRFRLHDASLPGKPDLVFRSRSTVVFVHGCFWHRHPSCKKSSTPETNKEFWEEKFLKNVERDRRARRELEELGWHVEVVWQCQIDEKNLERLATRLRERSLRATPS